MIQMDGITRENAGVGIDEKVTVRDVASKPARKIALTPLTPPASWRKTPTPSTSARSSKDCRSPWATGCARVCSGERLRFLVEDASPEGVVLVTSSTSIHIKTKGAKVERAKVAYEDIGGLGPQIRRIREMIELPLKYPEVFNRLA